jgi:hypothetical protein
VEEGGRTPARNRRRSRPSSTPPFVGPREKRAHRAAGGRAEDGRAVELCELCAAALVCDDTVAFFATFAFFPLLAAAFC